MGTRGMFVFKFKGKTIYMYNHYDSRDVAEYLRIFLRKLFSEFTLVEIINKFDSLIIVTDEKPPTRDDIKKLSMYGDTNVSEDDSDLDWYSLLRGCQGNLGAVFESGYFYSADCGEQEINFTIDFDNDIANRQYNDTTHGVSIAEFLAAKEEGLDEEYLPDDDYLDDDEQKTKGFKLSDLNKIAAAMNVEGYRPTLTLEIKLMDLNKIAVGLNIEGYRPTLTLPDGCTWYNLIQVIDEPLKGNNFDDVMKIVNEKKLEYIEQAVSIDIGNFIEQLKGIINKIKHKHKNLLVHIHQYTGTTILNKTLESATGVKTILDTTNFFETPINYKKEYPDIDGLISISQCAGFGLPAGSWIIPTGFMEFDVKKNTIYTKTREVDDHISKYVDFEFSKGIILMVNDLWNPNLETEEFVTLYSN